MNPWNSARDGHILKLFGVAVLSLALLVPLVKVSSLVYERRERRDEAVREITATWGEAQTVVGPVLTVPYRYRYEAERQVLVDGKLVTRTVTETAVDTAVFLPEALEADAELSPKVLHRGIYDAVVYTGRVALKGSFAKPDWKALKVDEADVLWDDAALTLAVADLRGAKGALTALYGGRRVPLSPGSRLPGFASGVHGALGGAARTGGPFELEFDMNGSGEVRFAPLGVVTRAAVRSAWPDPKFLGAFLPADRSVSGSGFTARWDVSYYGRSYPQLYTVRRGAPDAAAVLGSTFGVAFLNSVDAYRNVERAVKYGLLFIAAVFTAFFLFETRSGLRIHPVQYLLVGLALVLFFLILLSLSEFLSFGLAYLAGAGAASLMAVLYSARFLGAGARTGSLAALLAGVYGYLFVVLSLQDYALLMGTALLAVMLAALMALTRDVDWYAPPEPPRP